MNRVASFSIILLAACGCGEIPPNVNPTACPAEAPETFDSCTGDILCQYGEETCCGETHAELGCNCVDGQFQCFFTDACLGAIAQCPEEFPCDDEECGPAPGAPNFQCDDGSVGGPVCERGEDTLCTWNFRECPEA